MDGREQNLTAINGRSDQVLVVAARHAARLQLLLPPPVSAQQIVNVLAAETLHVDFGQIDVVDVLGQVVIVRVVVEGQQQATIPIVDARVMVAVVVVVATATAVTEARRGQGRQNTGMLDARRCPIIDEPLVVPEAAQ